MRKVIKIKIAGYGRESVELSFDEEPTVEEVLSDAGISLSAGEKTSVNGETADNDDVLENGDTIQIIGKKEGGLK